MPGQTGAQIEPVAVPQSTGRIIVAIPKTATFSSCSPLYLTDNDSGLGAGPQCNKASIEELVMTRLSWLQFQLIAGVLATCLPNYGRSENPTSGQALRLAPIQLKVDIDRPDPKQFDQYSVKAASTGKNEAGWIVEGPAGQTLRRFVDTNKDNKVDLWCYYKRGVEVYRDIDADFNGKADQYRWLGTAGMRWGLDPDEDGQINQWKAISAEEVTAEVVTALATGDVDRFKLVLLTTTELSGLQLGATHTEQLLEKLKGVESGFERLVTAQKVVRRTTRWVHSVASRPSLIPAGTRGSRKDLTLYENVAAVIETGSTPQQISIGTLIQVRDGWRVVDLPHGFSPDQELTLGAEIFFPPAMQPVSLPAAATPVGISDAGQELLAQLNTIDEELETTTRTTERISLHIKRADILSKLSQQSKPGDEQQTWVRQLADTVSAAVQTGELPSGVERLAGLVRQLTREQQPDSLIAYVHFRHLSADYAQKINEPDADFGAIQQQWLANLKQFVTAFPKSEDAAEAMLQLAIAREFENLETEASTWYSRIIKQYPNTIAARKAAGAQRRLRSVGQKIALRGTTLSGTNLDLASLRGMVVLVHYWATWCEPCLEQMEQLRTLQTRYGRNRFKIVGVNLDASAQDVKAYLQDRRFPWPHLFAEGGLDSRLANELGILSLPTMLLVGADGKVLTRNLHIEAAEAQVKAALR